VAQLKLEMIQLVTLGAFLQRLEKQWHSALESLLNQQAFTDPAPAVNHRDLGLGSANEPLEPLQFTFPAYEAHGSIL
jgi:hypothetical protein